MSHERQSDITIVQIIVSFISKSITVLLQKGNYI